jgi:hypothetical protein
MPRENREIAAPPLEALADCREGYPWLTPHHRQHQSDWQGTAAVFDLGVRWQSLIICPDRPVWMVPPVVPTESRFEWWSRLRDVPSSWVASRGEADRFLYYDGPTSALVPIKVALDDVDDRLQFAENIDGPTYPQHRTDERPWVPFIPLKANGPAHLPAHEGLYIDVHAGSIRGRHVIVDPSEPVETDREPTLQGDAVIQRFREMLITYGLTPAEAEGLVAAWTPQFFHTNGRRFVLRMSPQEYARLCPMQIRPMPTEVCRLGLVLSEFDKPPATQPAATQRMPGLQGE